MYPSKILYVDDEPDNLFSFQAGFRRHFDILTATSAEAALEILEKGEVAVLLSDQRMPGMTGAELLAIARTRWPQVLRLLVTGYSDIEVVIDAINKGQIYHYITKPWHFDSLRQTLENALEMSRLSYENQSLTEQKLQLEVAALNAEKSAMEARWQALQSKLQPHFLFNALNTLPPLIQEDTPRAIAFVSALARLLRRLADNNSSGLATMEQEVSVTKDYLTLQEIRFEGKLFVSWQLPQPLPQLMLPQLSLQLVVENALKHNEISMDTPLNIAIVFDASNQSINVTNTWQPRIKAEEGLGIGLDNIRSRYHLAGSDAFVYSVKDGVFRVCLPLLTPNSNTP